MNETIDTMPHIPQTCIFSVTWLAGDVKEPTHLSKRVGHVVSGRWSISSFISHFMHGLGG